MARGKKKEFGRNHTPVLHCKQMRYQSGHENSWFNALEIEDCAVEFKKNRNVMLKEKLNDAH